MTFTTRFSCFCIATILLAGGCRSSTYAGRGTALGALGGAGVGALIGRATGHTAAGALIGTGVGAVAGAAVGTALDDAEARNRAEIAAQLGRPVSQGTATTAEVVAMTHAGVDSHLIVNYVNGSGMAQPIMAQDVIYLHEQGVSTDVIQAMQNPRLAQTAPVAVSVEPPRRTVIIQEEPWEPYYYPHYGFSYGSGCGCR